ncbi:MAG: hypothetical protein E6G94_05170 [Alphaproteobacteria bacterium]|nr:MAG: hypothetical protein E6G94_05170 [Alphaproteobacteria bacterium]
MASAASSISSELSAFRRQALRSQKHVAGGEAGAGGGAVREDGEDAGPPVEPVERNHRLAVGRQIFGEMVEEEAGEREFLPAERRACQRQPVGDPRYPQIRLAQRSLTRFGGHRLNRCGDRQLCHLRLHRESGRRGGKQKNQVEKTHRSLSAAKSGRRKGPGEVVLHPAEIQLTSRQTRLRAVRQVTIVVMSGGEDAEDDCDQRDQRDDEAAAKLVAINRFTGRRDLSRRRARGRSRALGGGHSRRRHQRNRSGRSDNSLQTHVSFSLRV